MFLSIYLLNLCGQLAVYQYLNLKADSFFNVQIKDGLYNVNDLTEIKIPASMPGVSEWATYEKVSGSIRFADESYNYVEMRVTRNAIYLKCVPNYDTTLLSNQNVIHAENIDGVKIPKKEHVPYGKSTVVDNLSFAFTKFEFNSPYKNSAIKIIQPVLQIICHSLDIPEQPPRSNC
ncbi:hypothetical protein [Mucilaginibacter xinganensis]|uniref:Uncharacterized protein n=1 Tax=Mucilaginibacter xinganensis TaxID=1234841 RepID=A0A223P2U2_9SPHI|nr:hypothetical protein [Mucilaginibacter xinganensis]ASU36386.1 hypothetical protein MuYL_4501 [Mucilaginibacter xinganensis]